MFNYNGIYPSFGDLDGDTLPDMLIGDNYGYFHFFKNNGTATPFTTVTTPQVAGIDVGQSARPFLYDLNKDGLMDILIGTRDGYVQYYWNFGTKISPLFHQDSVNAQLGRDSSKRILYQSTDRKCQSKCERRKWRALFV